MSDDSDLMIAAAATAALVTWMGTRHHGARAHRDWAATLGALRAALRRTWHETPGYVLIQAIRQALRRPRK